MGLASPDAIFFPKDDEAGVFEHVNGPLSSTVGVAQIRRGRQPKKAEKEAFRRSHFYGGQTCPSNKRGAQSFLTAACCCLSLTMHPVRLRISQHLKSDVFEIQILARGNRARSLFHE